MRIGVVCSMLPTSKYFRFYEAPLSLFIKPLDLSAKSYNDSYTVLILDGKFSPSKRALLSNRVSICISTHVTGHGTLILKPDLIHLTFAYLLCVGNK